MAFFSRMLIQSVTFVRGGSTPDANGDPTYPGLGVAAVGHVSVLNAGLIGKSGDWFQIVDANSVTKKFEWLDLSMGGVVTIPGAIAVNFDQLGTPAAAASAAAAAITAVASFAVSATSALGVVTATADSVGVAGNQAITKLASDPGSFTVDGMSGGVDGGYTTAPAKVIGQVQQIRDADGNDRQSRHTIYTEAEIRVGDRVWVPALGDDVNNLAHARLPLNVTRSPTLDGSATLYRVFLG